MSPLIVVMVEVVACEKEGKKDETGGRKGRMQKKKKEGYDVGNVKRKDRCEKERKKNMKVNKEEK